MEVSYHAFASRNLKPPNHKFVIKSGRTVI